MKQGNVFCRDRREVEAGFEWLDVAYEERYIFIS